MIILTIINSAPGDNGTTDGQGSVWWEKNAKENDFLMFGSTMENIKENQI